MKTTMLSYEQFAKLLAYPCGNYPGLTLEVAAESNDEHLARFAAETSALTREEFEELYTRTFDINPVATLEIGWHLYGETYERGSFLVTMRQLLRRLKIPETTELPDHLSHILQALDRLGQSDEANELAARYVAPALAKILDSFAGKQNPYEHLLRALQNCIIERHLNGVERHA